MRALKIAGGYLGAALILTWPLALHFRTHCWGYQGDLWGALWNFWYLKTQIAGASWNLYAHNTFYPYGLNLWQDLGHFMVPVLAAPLQGVFSLPVSYNILTLAFLTLNAWCTWLLLDELTHSPAAAWLGGLALLWCPYFWAHLAVGSVELLAFWWVPLALRSFIKLKAAPGYGNILGAAGFWLLATLANWLYGVLTGIAFVLLLLFPPWRGSAALAWRVRALLAGCVFALLLAPWAWNLRAHYPGLFQSKSPAVLTPASLERCEAILEGDVPLAKLQPGDIALVKAWHGAQSALRLGDFMAVREHFSPRFNTPGLLLMLLALLGLVLGGVGAGFWGVLAALAGLMALGPYYLGRASPFGPDGTRLLPLPFAWLERALPWLAAVERKERLVILMYLALVVLSAFVWRWLELRYLKSLPPWGYRLALAGLSLVVVLDFAGYIPWQSPRALTRVEVPGVYYRLGRTYPPGAVLELPAHNLPGSNMPALLQFYQSVHHQPTFNAALLRPEMWLTLARAARSNSWLRYVLQPWLAPEGSPPGIKLRDIAQLQSLGFRYLVVHTEVSGEDRYSHRLSSRHFVPEAMLHYLRQIFPPPLESGEGILLYAFAPRAGLAVDRRGYIKGLVPYRGEPLEFADPQRRADRIGLSLAPGESLALPVMGVRSGRIALYLRSDQPGTGELCLRWKAAGLLAQRRVRLQDNFQWQRLAFELPRAPDWLELSNCSFRRQSFRLTHAEVTL